MRIAVLASPDSWYFCDLVRAAGADHHLICLPFSEIQSQVDRDGSVRITTAGYAKGSGVFGEESLSTRGRVLAKDSRSAFDLTQCDAVLVRTMPPGSLEQVVFRMDALAQLEAAGVLVLNPPKAVEVAVDKYLTTAKLARAGLLSPRTIACQTPEDAMLAFAELGGDVVVKPLFGSEGRGITRLNDEALALRAFKMLAGLGAVLYVQEFIPHEGYDCRLLLIGDEVYAMRRRSASDWRTNVSRGAETEPLQPDDTLVEMARRAAAAVGAPLAGVDLLPGRDGKWYVLEVNAVPGWMALAKTLKVDIARRVIEFTARNVG
jgi:ribosomal protein S6--L-glutamate ligase